MNTQQTQLYQRIQAFSLDDPHADLCFSQRLARDNSWTQQYTQRVIEEYKKFIFLAMVAGHRVRPSDQVDQVWHLHLTYTRSYWNEFCAKVLHKPLHHNPTRGGSSEQENLHRWYNETLISYEKFFGQAPPKDIWAPPDLRFNQMTKFRRINSQAYWLIPKPSFQLVTMAALSLLVALIVGSVVPSITTAITEEPWVSLLLTFLTFSTLNFIVAVGLSFRKSYVYPGSKARVRAINKQEIEVRDFLYMGFLCLIIPALPKIITFLPKMLHDLNIFSFLIVSIFLLFLLFLLLIFLFFVVPAILAEWICKFLANLKKQKFFQLFYCRICNSPLEQLDSITQFLNKAEQVAAKIGSIEFEVWYCQQCCSEIGRDSIHLRAYVEASKSNKFNHCSSCQEITMTNISSVLESATEQEEGRRLVGYQCRCCGRSEEQIKVIPRISSDGCCD